VPARLRKPRSYDDCIGALERGLREAALEIVSAVFAAELARLEAQLFGGLPVATGVGSPARQPRTPRPGAGTRPTVGSPPQRPSPRVRHIDIEDKAEPLASTASSPAAAADARAEECVQPTAEPRDDVETPGAPTQAVAVDASHNHAVKASRAGDLTAPPIAQSVHAGSPFEFGIVKWFSDDKGYGFIAGDDGQDVFVHRSALAAAGLRTLRDGQRVRFAEEAGTKGPVATRVCAA
jgi:CspA family cold shock protein